MKNYLLFTCILAPCLLFAGINSSAQISTQNYSWGRTMMDASRTGVIVPGENNISEALGTVKGKTYTAPNGRVYKGGTIPKVAKTVMEAQAVMAPVKKVVAYAPEAMETVAPESPLSNWFADNLIRVTEEITGRHVDICIGNFGGIRVNMPQGDVLYDDIRSMFPFKNSVCYLTLKGQDVRVILEGMAASNIEVLGGVRIVVKDGKLVSAEVGGEPLDDDKLYGVTTISFLLDGGDDLYVVRNAVEFIDTQVDIFDAVMIVINEDTAAGRPLTGSCDGRVTILKD